MKRVIAFIFLGILISKLNCSAITFNVTVPVGTYECWLAGNFKTDVNQNWDINTFKMAKIDDTHFSLEIPDVVFAAVGLNTSTIRYKYLNGPSDWAFVEKNSSGNDISVRSYTGNDLVAKWGAVCKTALVRILTSKSVSECYLIGNFNNWTVPGTPDTKMNFDAEFSDANSNYFYKLVRTSDLTILNYKFAAGPGVTYLQTQSALWYASVAVCGTAFYNNISFSRIYNSSTTKTVTINTTVPTGTEAVYLMGSNVQWDGVRWLAGTKNADGTFSFVINNIDIMQYKYYNFQNWMYNEVDANNMDKPDRTIDAQVSTVKNDVIVKWKTPIVNNLIKTNIESLSINRRELNLSDLNGRLKIYDIFGRVIVNQTVYGNYNMSYLNPGMYVLQINNKAYKVIVN